MRKSLENGEIDYLEAVSEGAETEFFQYINAQGFLSHLADSYLLEKKKVEVPIWLYIASDLILRLHGMQSFHGYPLVIRTGELLNAFGPEVGKKVVHPQTGQVTIQCSGFNRKTCMTARLPATRTGCERLTEAAALLQWYSSATAFLMSLNTVRSS